MKNVSRFVLFILAGLFLGQVVHANEEQPNYDDHVIFEETTFDESAEAPGEVMNYPQVEGEDLEAPSDYVEQDYSDEYYD